MASPKKPTVQTIHAAIWPCLLSSEKRLDFLSMEQAEKIHFLVGSRTTQFRVNIPRRSPFRVVDEGYLSEVGNQIAATSKKLGKQSSTWKLWGTPFLKSLEKTDLFHNRPKSDRFSYLILTSDECVEFVSPEPKIEVIPDPSIGE